MTSRHDWLSWDQYTAAHESNLRRFPSFIVDDALIATPLVHVVFWSGRLLCQDGIEIHVTKAQAVRERAGRREVRTETYSYHALRKHPDGRVQDILRYDNAHPHEEHNDAHHKHIWPHGREMVLHIGEKLWPTLGDVIAEVEEWWAGPLLRG